MMFYGYEFNFTVVVHIPRLRGEVYTAGNFPHKV